MRHAAALELGAHVAARGAREEDDEPLELAVDEGERLDEHVGALDRLRLGPVPHPDAVLLERADDERVGVEAELGPGGVAPAGVGEREAVELDPDRDPVHPRRVDARGDDEQLHLAMRHLDPVEAVGVARERLVGTVELGEAGRPRAAVEVRHPEPVGRARPARVERGEVARVEDDLPPREPRPRGRPERVARLARDGGHVGRLVVERPAELVAEDEEAGAVGPVARPPADRGLPQRPADGSDEAPRVPRGRHRRDGAAPPAGSVTSGGLRPTAREDSGVADGVVAPRARLASRERGDRSRDGVGARRGVRRVDRARGDEPIPGAGCRPRPRRGRHLRRLHAARPRRRRAPGASRTRCGT